MNKLIKFCRIDFRNLNETKLGKKGFDSTINVTV